MNPWLLVVDLFRAVLFSVAHVTGGSLGASILVVSTVLRIALLPITIRGTVRFLWIRDLAAPDLGIALVAAICAAAAAKLDPNAMPSSRAWIAAAAITFTFAWRLAAGVGLYRVASSVAGAGQSPVLWRVEGAAVRVSGQGEV